MIERSVLAEPSSELRVPGVGAATSAPGGGSSSYTAEPSAEHSVQGVGAATSAPGAELGGPGRFPRGPGVLGDPGNLRILAKLEKCWHNKKRGLAHRRTKSQGFSDGFLSFLIGKLTIVPFLIGEMDVLRLL